MIEHLLLGGPMIADILVGIVLGIGCYVALRCGNELIDRFEPVLLRVFGTHQHSADTGDLTDSGQDEVTR